MSTPRRAARYRSSLLLLAWLLCLGVAIWVLTAAGRGALATPSVLEPGAWAPWAAGRDALTIGFAALRLLTLAVAWYLLGATLVGGAARLVRWRRMVAVADLLTVPTVRRLLQSALGVGLATAALSVGSPASRPPAHPAPTLTMTAGTERDAVVMMPLSGAQERMTPVADLPVPEAVPEAPRRQWTVQAGDHFWSITERVLADAWGRRPVDGEIVGYWEDLMAANAGRLVDPDNPDLIVPGQTFALPPPPGPGVTP